MPKFVMLWTDVAVWLLIVAMVAYGWTVVRKPNLSANWGKVFRNAPALSSSGVRQTQMAIKTVAPIPQERLSRALVLKSPANRESETS